MLGTLRMFIWQLLTCTRCGFAPHAVDDQMPRIGAMAIEYRLRCGAGDHHLDANSGVFFSCLLPFGAVAKHE
ncbi:hypothetical protein BD779DRAFT_1507051 [Infundibulicybe gibba]|nr:hypothetical protein BD779DRAFT_1507051 [Infundibulicybe gibba]